MPGTNPLDALALLEQQSAAELDAQEEFSDDEDEMMEEDSEAGDEMPSEAEIEAMDAPFQMGEELHSNQSLQLEIDEPSFEDDEQLSTVNPSLLVPSNGASLPENLESAASPRTELPPQLPFNLLHTGETDISLLRDILYHTDHPNCTRVYSQRTLHQKLPPGLHHLRHIERLNMIAQIPELGVVLIGNQAGRVGVLTTTYWQATQQAGYRVEYILPFKSQEEKGVRPEEPLMGMAVSPLQGHEYRPDPSSIRGMTSERASPYEGSDRRGSSRRFRLLMMYYDHTVLSYEISRPSEDEVLVA